MSQENDSHTGLKIAGIALIILVLVAGCPLLFYSMGFFNKPDANCGSATPGFNIDPNSVPNGITAGIGTKHAVTTKEQVVHAAIIMQVAKQMKLTVFHQKLGVMVAIGESDLINVDRGDKAGPDSRGLFQQRANGAWGSYADRMNPVTAATNFYKALMQKPGYDKVVGRAEEATAANRLAHIVQGNRDPNHYRPYYSIANELVSKLGGVDIKVQSAQATSGEVVGNAGEGPSDSKYSLPGSQPAAKALAKILGPKFGIAAVGGIRARPPDGGNNSDHYTGMAVDFMTTKSGDAIDHMSAAEKAYSFAKGDPLASYAQEHAKDLGIKYIIWRQRIWHPDKPKDAWKHMENRGNDRTNHNDHVHISLLGDADLSGYADQECSTGDGAVLGAGATNASSSGWANPAVGKFTSPYGLRLHPTQGVMRMHWGVDIAAPNGTPIYAANSGKVIEVSTGPVTGWAVRIAHDNGYQTRYLHMNTAQDVLVRVGQTVKSGQQIAKMGSGGRSTGPHLHFELKIKAGNGPVNPVPHFKSWGITLGTAVKTSLPQRPVTVPGTNIPVN